jgi:integrase
MSSKRGFVKKRGKTWTAYWKVDTPNGLKQRTKGGFQTRREAEVFLMDTISALRSGRFAEPSKVTVAEYLIERWLPGRAASLRPSTLDGYRRIVERHVVPAVGHLRLQHLSADQLDVLYAKLLSDGLAPKTVRNVHTTIHKALRDAVRKDLVPRNVADAADAPKLTRPGEKRMKTWTPAEVTTFFEAIAEHRLAIAYVLAATTGMRRGEILGLRWNDVDIKGRRLTITRTILSVAYEITEGTPKTAKGRRSIALDAETARLLGQHRALQSAERGAGPTAGGDDFVFSKPDGRPIHPDYFSQTFDRTVKRLGLPRIRLHDLRHTHATLGLAAGVPVKIMSERLGHATAAFTQDVYMHAIPAMEEAAADQIGELLFGSDDDEPSSDNDDTSAEEGEERKRDSP